MRILIIALAFTAALTEPAFSQPAIGPKAGMILLSSDGKRIGRIERIVGSAGQAQMVSVIYDSRFVYLPLSTLTLGEDGRATTSLTRKEVSALR